MKLKATLFVGVVLLALSLRIGAVAAPPTEKPILSAQSSELKVSVDIPELYSERRLFPRTLINQDPKAHFHVVIENVSSRQVFLSRFDALTIEMTDAQGQTIIVRPRPTLPHKFGKNIPHARRLAPGDVEVWEVYYGTQGNVWEPFPFPKGMYACQTVTLRAVLQQSPSPNGEDWLSRDLTGEHLWTGRAESKPYTVVLENEIL